MRYRRLTALLIALLLLTATLGSCQPEIGGNDETTTTPADGTTEEQTVPDGMIAIIADGVCNYKIVRSENASDYIKNKVVEFRTALREYSDEVPLSDDWELNLDTASAELAGRYEILIGNTNRPESAAAAEGLLSNEYRISISGNKIVIVGGSDLALAEGCRAFLEAVTVNAETKTMKISATALFAGEYNVSYLIGLTDQHNSTVSVYDLSTGSLDTSAAVWSHKFSAYNIAGTKFREYNGAEVVLAAFGSTNAEMVDYATGKTLWSTASTASNPHSVELMPCGVIAVAASTGGEIRFFDATGNGTTYVSTSLADAHGVLWDPENNVMWAVGENVLAAYTVELSGGVITVSMRNDLSTTIPTSSAHDLQPVYGDTDKLWITTGSTVYQYSKSAKTFSTDYAGNSVINRKSIKGIGNFEDGSVVSIFPDGVYLSWTSASIVFTLKDGDNFTQTTIKATDADFYKIRVWNKNYQ